MRNLRLLFGVFFLTEFLSSSECFQLTYQLNRVLHTNLFSAVGEELVAKTSDNAFTVQEGYSRYLVSKRRKNKVLRMRDRILKEIKRQRDKEDSTLEAVFDDKLPFLKLRFPTKDPGQLILIRSGESEWNAESRFTGWAGDPDLTDQGRREMEHAARLLIEAGYEIDVIFTSRLVRSIHMYRYSRSQRFLIIGCSLYFHEYFETDLFVICFIGFYLQKRAIRSVWTITNELGQQYLPVFKSWRCAVY
jgi:hypothetical protein